MSLPKEKQVTIVISHKEKIVKLTNKILEILHDAEGKKKFSNEQKLLLKKHINGVVSELTIIASFCGSNERNWAVKMTESIARLSVVINWYLTSVIEFWCTMANSITLDFNKTPFKFFGGDFKVKWHEFVARLRTLIDRSQVSERESMLD